MSAKLLSLVLGIVCGAIVYLFFAWLITRFLVLHKRVKTTDLEHHEDGHHEPPPEDEKPLQSP